MVAELDLDINGPLLIVVVLVDLDLACASNTVKGGGKLLTDTAHEFLEFGLPVILEQYRISLVDLVWGCRTVPTLAVLIPCSILQILSSRFSTVVVRASIWG